VGNGKPDRVGCGRRRGRGQLGWRNRGAVAAQREQGDKSAREAKRGEGGGAVGVAGIGEGSWAGAVRGRQAACYRNHKKKGGKRKSDTDSIRFSARFSEIRQKPAESGCSEFKKCQNYYSQFNFLEKFKNQKKYM
jgi:hypothetical protein